jgi:flagellar protein FliO/FliZ
MVLSLSIVLTLLWVVARIGRKRQAGGARMRRATASVATGQVDLLGRRSIGRNSSIAVVRVDGRTMVVGQTPQQITLLGETTDEPALTSPQVGAIDVGTARVAPTDAALPVGSGTARTPWPASDSGAGAPTAWDALLERLREMTVRH